MVWFTLDVRMIVETDNRFALQSPEACSFRQGTIHPIDPSAFWEDIAA